MCIRCDFMCDQKIKEIGNILLSPIQRYLVNWFVHLAELWGTSVYIRHLDTYSNVSTSAAWRNAWWSQWRMNISGASSSCIPCNTAEPWSHVSLIQHSKNTITSHQYIEQICSLWNFCKDNIFFFLNAFRISQIIEIDS